jgi:hypothetical protein
MSKTKGGGTCQNSREPSEEMAPRFRSFHGATGATFSGGYSSSALWKWSDLVRATCDPETAEGAAALLASGSYKDDLGDAYDALDRDDRGRIKDKANEAHDAALGIGLGGEEAKRAWGVSLRDGVADAIRGGGGDG